MTITCARAEQIAFSTVYFDAGQRLLVPRDSPIRGPADLAGKRVCSQVATTSLATVARVAPEATLLAVRNWTIAWRRCSRDRPMPSVPTTRYSPAWPYKTRACNWWGPTWRPNSTASASTKSQDDLVRAVNASLERIRADGTWSSLYRKWLAVLGPSPNPPRPKYRD